MLCAPWGSARPREDRSHLYPWASHFSLFFIRSESSVVAATRVAAFTTLSSSCSGRCLYFWCRLAAMPCAGVERLGCLPGGRRCFPAASAQMSTGGGAIAGVAGLIWSGIRGAADVLSRAINYVLRFSTVFNVFWTAFLICDAFLNQLWLVFLRSVIA